jgi:3-oxoacyl-[acyl-carrier protein] reductase
MTGRIPTLGKIPARVALVTGASEGIGLACARALAAAGARVAILSRREDALRERAEELAAETGGEVVPVAGDLLDPETPRRAVQETVSRLGPVEILVANVGGPPRGRAGELDDEAWRTAIDGVLWPALRLTRAVVPEMRTARFGRIVHVLSVTVRQPVPALTTSNALRPAVAGLIADHAREYGVHGITVNGVLPGYTRTARLEQLGASAPERLRRLEQEVPAGRLADPSEVAAVALFLASDAASYVNGVLIPADGGLSAAPR